MTNQAMARAGDQDSMASGGRSGWRKPALRGLVLVLAVVGVVAIVVSFLPQYVARYLVSHYLAGVDIDVSGVETLDIHPFRQEIAFGPVKFGSAGRTAEAAKIGKIGIKFDASRLFQKRAMVQAVTIEGIRIDIRQAADGELLINGISLRRILEDAQDPEEAGQQVQNPKGSAERSQSLSEDQRSWKAGLDSLRLRDSQIVFTDERGGQATLNVSELDLDGFLSWTPDEPGTFRLFSELNGIGITAAGQATPFAENVGLDATVSVSGVTIPKVEQYLGGQDFNPSGGVIDLTTRLRGALFPDGRVEGEESGEITVRNINIARADFGAVKLPSGAITLNRVTFAYGSEGNIDVAGQIDVALQSPDIALTDGTRIQAASIRGAVAEVVARLPVGGPPMLSGKPQVTVEKLVLGGPDVEGTIESATFSLSSFNVDPSADTVKLIGNGPLDANRVALSFPDEAGAASVAVNALHADLEEAQIVIAGDRLQLNGAVQLAATGTEVRIVEMAGARRAPVEILRVLGERVTGRVPALLVENGPAGTKVTVTGEAEVSAVELRSTPPAPGERVALRAISATARAAGVMVDNSAVGTRVQGPSAAAVSGLTLRIEEPTGAQRTIARLTSEQLRVDLASLDVNAPTSGAVRVLGTGRTQIERLKASMPGGRQDPSIEVGLRSLGLDFSRLDVAVPDQGIAISGRAQSRLSSLQATVLQEGALEVRSDVPELALDLRRLTYREGKPPAIDVELSGRARVARADLSMPGASDQTATEVRAEGLDIVVAEAAYAHDGGAPRWRTRLNLNLRSLLSEVTAGDAVTVRAGGAVIKDLIASTEPEYAVELFAIDSLAATLTRGRPAATGPAPATLSTGSDSEQKPKESATGAVWPPPDLPIVRIGRMGLPNGATIKLLDEAVTPPITATIEIESFALMNVDTTRPEQPTDVNLRVRLVQREGEGRLGVQGSASIFQERPDFDLFASIAALGLPLVSPYIAPQVGLDIVGGMLDAKLTGRAKAGQLESDVFLTLKDLAFLDHASAPTNQGLVRMGVPLTALIKLLEDPDGTIDLELPISGDMMSPEFDYSKVIWSTIYRVIRAAIVSPFKLASASFALIGASSDRPGGAAAADTAEAAELPMLSPILFAPGKRDLSLEAVGSVTSLKQVLKDRPRMTVSLCGIAVGLDLEAMAGRIAEKDREKEIERMAPQLTTVARERMLAVSQELGKGGVGPGQIALCPEPRVVPADSGPPRVDIGY